MFAKLCQSSTYVSGAIYSIFVQPIFCCAGNWTDKRQLLDLKCVAFVIKRAIFQTFWRLHCCPDFLFIELDTSNFGYLLIFWFCWTEQSLRKIGQHLYYTFYNGQPLDVFCFCIIYQKFKGGTLVKCLI